MKIKIKALKKVLEKAIAKDTLSIAGLKGLQQFDDSIVDFSDEDEVDLAEVLAMIANDVDNYVRAEDIIDFYRMQKSPTDY